MLVICEKEVINKQAILTPELTDIEWISRIRQLIITYSCREWLDMVTSLHYRQQDANRIETRVLFCTSLTLSQKIFTIIPTRHQYWFLFGYLSFL